MFIPVSSRLSVQAGFLRIGSCFVTLFIPDVGRRGEHVLFFDWDAYFPGRGKLEALGRRWGISNSDRVVAQVFDVVAGWQQEFSDTGVTAKDILRFKDIDAHLRG